MELVFWIILVFFVGAVFIPVIVGMITRSFLKAKYDSRLNYLKELKKEDHSKKEESKDG